MKVLFSTPGFGNKGDHMMILNVIDMIKNRYNNAQFYVPYNFKNSEFIKEYGIGYIFNMHKYRNKVHHRLLRVLGNSLDLVVPKIGNTISSKELDVIIDTSGYYVADHWGVDVVGVIARYYNRYRKNGTKIILMPKAYGPINNKDLITNTNELINSADLSFAREEKSMEILSSIGSNMDNIYVSPDFTLLIKPEFVNWFDYNQRYVVLVPNERMLTIMDKWKYYKFLRQAYSYIRKEYKVFVLIHSKKDDELINEIGIDAPVINSDNPRVLKGIISKAKYIVGSRYHSIISSLSQNVPAIGTSWSHKYEELYKEYDISNLIYNFTGEDDLKQLIFHLNDPNTYGELIGKLSKANKLREEKTLNMWNLIYKTIDSR